MRRAEAILTAVTLACAWPAACVSFGSSDPDATRDAGGATTATDATDDATEGAAPPFCTGQALCDDFDGLTFLPTAQWSRQEASALLARDPSRRKSPPYSLAATVDGVTRDVYTSRLLAVPPEAKGLFCTLSFNHEQRLNGDPMATFFQTLAVGADGGVERTLSLEVGESGGAIARVVAPNGSTRSAAMTGLTANKWHTTAVRWRFGAEVEVSFPGSTTLIPAKIELEVTTPVVKVDVRIGVSFNYPSRHTIFYDDVACSFIL